MNILDKIVQNKLLEVDYRKKNTPIEVLRRDICKSSKSFALSISKSGGNKNIIAEIKKTSPTMKLKKEINVEKIARLYKSISAVMAISVLCDEKYFSGSLRDLNIVSNICDTKPILCKDFIIDEYQLYEARKAGADAVLLIVSILSDKLIDKFTNLARELAMDAVIEVSDEQEMNRFVSNNWSDIVMINNRNLKTFEIDLDTTNNLVNLISDDNIVISASGINSKKDIEYLSDRVDAVLVGTSIMESHNPMEKINELAGNL